MRIHVYYLLTKIVNIGSGTEAGTVIRNGGLATGAKEGYDGWTEVWYEGQGIG